MNLNLPGVVLLGVGALFMYTAVKQPDKNPAQVVQDALKRGGKPAPAGNSGVTGAPGTPNNDTPTTPTGGGLVPFENRSRV